VEGEPRGRGGPAPLDESKRDFWDSFGKAPEERGLGTSAMRTGGGGGGGGGGSGAFEPVREGAVGGGGGKKEGEKEKDEWDNW